MAQELAEGLRLQETVSGNLGPEVTKSQHWSPQAALCGLRIGLTLAQQRSARVCLCSDPDTG